MMNYALKTMNSVFQNDELCIKNDRVCIYLTWVANF